MDLNKKELSEKQAYEKRLHSWVNRHGYFPDSRKIYKIVPKSALDKYWGSVYKLAEASNLVDYKRPYDVRNGVSYVSKDRLISEIRDLYRKLGYPPHAKDYCRAETARNIFGTNWNHILKECGIKVTFMPHSVVSKEEILARIQKYIDQYGKFPDTQHLFEMVPYGQYKYFWNSTELLAAEFNVKMPGRVQRKKELRKKIVAEAQKFQKSQRPVMIKDFQADIDVSSAELSNFVLFETNQKIRSVQKYLEGLGFNINWKNSYDRHITILGKTYKNKLEAAQELGMSPNTLSNRLKKYGLDNPELLNIGIVLQGKRYRTLTAAAKANHLNPDTLSTRLRKYGHDSPLLFHKGRITKSCSKALEVK